MIVVYGIIVCCLVLLLKSTGTYKKEYKKELNLKEHPFKFFYGTAMFAEDKILSRIKFFKEERVEAELKALYVKEKVESVRYLMKIKKTAMCIFIFMIFIFIGFGKAIEEELVQYKFIQSLTRPGYGEGNKNYEIEAIVEGKEEKLAVHIQAEEKKPTQEEVIKKFDEHYRELLDLFLGKNKQQDEVMYPLSLIKELEDIHISWQIENTELIDYTGEIYPDETQENGLLTYVTAEMSLGEVKKEYEIPVVIKKGGEKKLSLEEQINSIIQENNSVYEEKIILPKEVENKKVRFFQGGESQSAVFLMGAVISVVILFVFQSRELSGKVKKRNEQMMRDYPEIVSKLTLLSEAGLSISGSWNKIVTDYEKMKNNKMRFAYEEMRFTNIKMKNGTPETMAYAEFGQRCGLQCYLRLGALLEQNVMKGTKGLKSLLDQEVTEAFEDRKRSARIRGEEAGTKLLLPMVLMLVIVIVVIVVPAFLSMNI